MIEELNKEGSFIHRIEHDKEMDLMTPPTNRKNTQRFKDLLGNFFYAEDTEQEVIQNLSPLTKPFPANYLDQKLNLNSQFRAWYEVEIDRENDLAFEQYERMLYNNFLHFAWHAEEYAKTRKIKEYNLMKRDPTPSELELIEKVRICQDYFIDDYEIWRRGKVLIGKNQQKLFRFCLKKKLLDQAQVDRLNTIKTRENNLYVCITRNPIDYLFSATNQSFTSCLDAIKSVGEGCYWMGLGALNIDNSRAMVFLSNGKLKSCSLHGYEFKHFGYLSRSWLMLGNKDELFVVGAYPEDKIGFESKLRDAGFPIRSLGGFEQSRLNFRMSRFQDGAECNIYLDDIGVANRRIADMKNRATNNRGRTWYYVHGGDTGSLHHFDYDGDFEGLRHFEDLYEGGNYCEDCGCFFRDDEGVYFENTGSLCQSCYNQSYVTCFHCGDATINDDSFTGPDDNEYCPSCFDTRYILCDCGTAVEMDYAYIIGDDTFCEDCIGQYCFRCEGCEEYFVNDDRWMHGASEYCQDCYDELFIDCGDCGETIDSYDSIEIDYISYCATCTEKIEEEKNEITN